jgi:hypothetical protein
MAWELADSAHIAVVVRWEGQRAVASVGWCGICNGAAAETV